MIPQGFRFAAIYAGIRKHPDDDLTLMVSDVPAAVAGVLTQIARRWITAVWILLEAFERDRLEVSWDRAVQLTRRGGLLFQDLRQCVHRAG